MDGLTVRGSAHPAVKGYNLSKPTLFLLEAACQLTELTV